MGLPSAKKVEIIKNIEGKIINVEELSRSVTGKSLFDNEFSILVENLAQRSVHFYLSKNENVIVDSLFLTESERKIYIAIGKKMNKKVELYWCDVTVDDLKKYEGECEFSLLSSKIEFPFKSEGMDSLFYIK